MIHSKNELINLFEEAELKKGDYVAIGMTGSLPGANIAVLSACKSMGINTVAISSVGSSSYGANREEFSWPFIENYLYNNNLIDNVSIAYSIGGKNDVGVGVGEDDIDRKVIKKITDNYDIDLIEIPLAEKGDGTYNLGEIFNDLDSNGVYNKGVEFED